MTSIKIDSKALEESNDGGEKSFLNGSMMYGAIAAQIGLNREYRLIEIPAGQAG